MSYKKFTFSFLAIIASGVPLFATCDGLSYRGTIAVGHDANIVYTDSVSSTIIKGGYEPFTSPEAGENPRYFLEKVWSGSIYSLTTKNHVEPPCNHFANHEDFVFGSLRYNITAEGGVEYAPENSLITAGYHSSERDSDEWSWEYEHEDHPTGSIDQWHLTVLREPTVKTFTADQSDCSAIRWGQMWQNLESEYTTQKLIANAPKALPPYTGQGTSEEAFLSLNADETEATIGHALYKLQFTPSVPDEPLVLNWIERFIPGTWSGGTFIETPNATPDDRQMTFPWPGPGTGVQETPIYELRNITQSGVKRVVLNTFSATFDLCPAGWYELTFKDSSGAAILPPERVKVVDVSKPVIFVRELPSGVTNASQIQATARFELIPQLAGTDSHDLGSVSWSVSLGAYDNGRSAGAIRLNQETLTAESYTPAALTYNMDGEPEIDVIYGADGALRQVFAPQALADIVAVYTLAEDFDYYEIRLFHPDDVDGFDPLLGVYTLKGSVDPVSGAFSRWRVDNPTPLAMTELRVRQMVGPNHTRLFIYDDTQDEWSLSNGGGLRTIVQRSELVPHPTELGEFDRLQTTTVSDNVFGEITKYTEKYRTYDWGEELVEEVRDPAGRALTTTWEYYDDDPGDGWRLGKLRSRLDPTDHWEFYDYDLLGRRIKTVSSWKGSLLVDVANESSEHKVQRVAYWEEDLDGDGNRDKVQRTVEDVEGQEVSRRFRIEWGKQIVEVNPEWTPGQPHEPPLLLTSFSTIRVATVAGLPDPVGAGNFTTTSHTYANGPWKGRPRRVLHPNGTVTLYKYTIADGVLTTTTYHGEPASGDELVETIVAGRVTITRVDDAGNTLSEVENDFESGVLLSSRQVQSADEFGRPLVIAYPVDGTSETFIYGAYGEVSVHTARDGTVTTNTPDALGRIYRTTRGGTAAAPGIAEEYSLDGNGRRRTVTRIATGLPPVLTQENHYDSAGDLVWSKDISTETTIYTPEGHDSVTGLWKRRVGFPDGGERIELTYPDGTIKEIKGSAVAHREYDYDTTALGERWTKEIFVGEGGTKTEWVTTYTDMLGRTVRREYPYPAGAEETWEFNAAGQLTAHHDADGVTRRFGYNSLGEMEVSAIKIDVGSEIAFDGNDRIRRTTRRVLPSGHSENSRGEDIVVTIEEAWPEDNADTPIEISRHESTTSGLRSWEVRAGATSSTVITPDLTGSLPIREVRSTQPDNRYSITRYIDGELRREARYGADDTLLHETQYLYDDHGRLQFADDLRNGRTTFQYNSADRLWKVTTPPPGDGKAPQTTEYGYDLMGRQNKIIHPDTAETHSEYWENGKLKKTWGDRTYPVDYTYDPQGRKRTMTTWQEFNQTTGQGTSGSAVTTWNYHSQRSWLKNKRYNDDKGPSYTYWPSGRLKTRTWARQVNSQDLVTTYTYNDAGDLWTTVYSDTTPSVTHTYNRLGQLKTTTDAAGLLTRGYTDAGALEYEDYTYSGSLSGVSIDREYDIKHRLRFVATDAGYGVKYLFDTAGRLSRIAESHHHADLGYEPGTEILNSADILRVGIPRLRHERSSDKLGRVEWVSTTGDGSVAVRRDYTHNAANQRTIIEHEDGRAWHYGYDPLGQVDSATKRLSSDPAAAVLPGYAFGYAFDDIGNRETATTNGNIASYKIEILNLNQYEERKVHGVVDVRGEALPEAEVMVGGLPTQRTGRDFYRLLPVDNTTNPTYSVVAVAAEVEKMDPVDESRWAFTPRDPEAFSYDFDGNLESDGRWDYKWDAENRLKSMETRTNVATAFPVLKQRLEFVYDFQGRRVQKVVKDWSSGTSQWQTITDIRFIYDGWNLIEERDALDGDAVIRKHVWGPDISGSMQGAGGVGGLLWTQTPTQTFAASSDANGNVVAWINTATLAIAGRADYSPFGKPVIQTGVANDLPFGFSTKYEDAETGLLYYGLRYQNPSTGRFLNRDPIEEDGGLNLYGFVLNDPVNRVDFLGLYDLKFRNERVSPYALIFLGYSSDRTPWTTPQKNIIWQTQKMAADRAYVVISYVYDYLLEIDELYCDTPGRATLKEQIEYIIDTMVKVGSALDGTEELVVSKATGDSMGQAFTRRGKIWFNSGGGADDFFKLPDGKKASTFIHEVSDVIDRARGRAANSDNLVLHSDGWHKVANFYNELSSSNIEVFFFQSSLAQDINNRLIDRGRYCDIILKKNGKKLNQ